MHPAWSPHLLRPSFLTWACLCRAVEVVCSEGPERVLELVQLGAEFTREADGNALHLTREGGHSARRIVHAADVTGREIERALLAAAESNPNVAFFEHHAAVDLIFDEVRTPSHAQFPLCCWPQARSRRLQVCQFGEAANVAR